MENVKLNTIEEGFDELKGGFFVFVVVVVVGELGGVLFFGN